MGHVLGAEIGGPGFEYNLIPQHRNVSTVLLLDWPKSFRKSVSWGIFYKMLNKPHNIFKDFEDEMTSSDKNFSEIYLGPPLYTLPKI
jgi:hypothetical protein